MRNLRGPQIKILQVSMTMYAPTSRNYRTAKKHIKTKLINVTRKEYKNFHIITHVIYHFLLNLYLEL